MQRNNRSIVPNRTKHKNPNAMTNTIKTQVQVRESFWAFLREANPGLAAKYRRTKRQNDYPTDIRVSFVDFVESLRMDGQISEALAYRVTL